MPETAPRLAVPNEQFQNAVDRLITDGDNLPVFHVGSQPAAVQNLHRQFLTWIDDVERTLRNSVDPPSYSLTLQTPRYVSLLEDRVPEQSVYRAIDAERQLVIERLKGLRSAFLERQPEIRANTDLGIAPALAAPKVFVSHASEDKQRFVLGLASRLRAVGIDAWLDNWELAPGDSLIARIFEEGIGTAQAFIIVLSRFSIDKPWVRRELDVAAVRNIEAGCRLIPIVLDDVEVPSVLQATVWTSISDPNSYDAEFERLVRAIYGASLKPPLGNSPLYLSAIAIPGLSPTDAVVLRRTGDNVMTSESLYADTKAVEQACSDDGLDRDGWFESVLALQQAGLLEAKYMAGTSHVMHLQMTNAGFSRYLHSQRPDVDELTRRLAAWLLANPPGPPAGTIDAAVLSDQLGESPVVIKFLLQELDALQLASVSVALGGVVRVHSISPLLRRLVEAPS